MYGGILYDDDKDYSQALKYFLLSEENNDPRAYYCLWMYYKEGKACEPQTDKAFEYVRKGVEQNCRDSLFALGKEYFEGVLVPKDIDRAKELLQKSAELGNGQAMFFKKVHIEIGMDNLIEEMKDTFIQALARIPVNPKPVVTPVAVDPYSPCSCDSGKKYRFCCMKKKDESKQNKPFRFISL